MSYRNRKRRDKDRYWVDNSNFVPTKVSSPHKNKSKSIIYDIATPAEINAVALSIFGALVVNVSDLV